MAQLKVEKIMEDLKIQGVDATTVAKVKNTILANMKAETIDKAVLFLGCVTLVLAVGSVLLGFYEKEVSDALWGALGAGIGGLAGIFMGKE